MALRDVSFLCGVAKDDADYSLKGYATATQWIRWVSGNCIPLGGYQQKFTTQMSGICRGIFEFATSDGSIYSAQGTHRRLYILNSNFIQNITPSESTGTFANNPFATVSGSPTITVTHTAHGRRNGDWVYMGNSTTFNGVTPGGQSGNLAASPFTTSNLSNVVQVTHLAHGLITNDEVNFTGSTALNGITISGVYLVRVLSANTYQIYGATAANASGSGGGTPAYIYRKAYQLTYVDANSYTINYGSNASGTGTGGSNAVQYLYELSSGLQNGVSGTGYSTGGYSVGPYSVSFAGSTITYNPRTWSFGKFGDILIANPSGGKIYEWSQNWSIRATQVSNSPAKCLYVIVTAQRQIIALGCTLADSTFDAMQMRWCDISDRTAWTPSQTNNAGNLKLSTGSNIVAGSSGDSGSLIWTDVGFYNLTYVGDFGQTYRADLIAPNWGLCGPNAFLNLGLEVYWVTPRGSFARYRGGVPQELPCRSKVWFNGKALGQDYKIYAFYDQKYPAVSWLFQLGATECDNFIRFDMGQETQDGAGGWSTSTCDRTAWTDTPIMRYPLAVDSSGYIYEHENGNSANGNAITRSCEWRELASWNDQQGQGDRVFNLNKIIPNVQVASGSVGIFFDFRRFPNDTVVTKPTTGIPFALTNAVKYLSVRGQGRSLAIRLISSSTNDSWTFGSPFKADISAGSRR